MEQTLKDKEAAPVNVLALKQHLSRPHARLDEKVLHVVVQHEGGMGGTPSVAIEQVAVGFDWDSRKLLLFPSVPLTKLTAEQVSAIETSLREGQSWHAHEQYEKYRSKISALNTANQTLHGVLKTLLLAENLTEEQKSLILSAQSIPGKTLA